MVEVRETGFSLGCSVARSTSSCSWVLATLLPSRCRARFRSGAYGQCTANADAATLTRQLRDVPAFVSSFGAVSL